MIEHALDAGRRLRSPHILFLAHAGSALLHRLHGRQRERRSGRETTRCSIHETEGAEPLPNRIDPDFEIASVLAVCYTVLGVIAVEQGDAEPGAEHLAEADRLRAEVGRAGADVPGRRPGAARGALASRSSKRRPSPR